jgi:acyl-coenzyme A thioesterase PaaI-like protein
MNEIMRILKNRMGDQVDNYRFPPPVFETMRGELLDLDLEKGILRARYPVLEEYLNPYSSLQGGIIAAAVDNTLGPLSVLVAPPNVTRKLELTYSLPIRLNQGFLNVEAGFLGQDGLRLLFKAEVRDPEGRRMARAKAVHVLIDP